MRLEQGAAPITVRWFKCPPGTPALKGHTPFRSLIWETDWRLRRDAGSPGEVPRAARTWTPPEPGASWGYKKACDPNGWLPSGIPPGSSWSPIDTYWNGVPICCGGPDPGPPPVATWCCPDNPTPATVYAKVTTSSNPTLIGLTFPVTWTGGGPGPFLNRWVGSGAVGGWTLTAAFRCQTGVGWGGDDASRITFGSDPGCPLSHFVVFPFVCSPFRLDVSLSTFAGCPYHPLSLSVRFSANPP